MLLQGYLSHSLRAIGRFQPRSYSNYSHYISEVSWVLHIHYHCRPESDGLQCGGGNQHHQINQHEEEYKHKEIPVLYHLHT